MTCRTGLSPDHPLQTPLAYRLVGLFCCAVDSFLTGVLLVCGAGLVAVTGYLAFRLFGQGR